MKSNNYDRRETHKFICAKRGRPAKPEPSWFNAANLIFTALIMIMGSAVAYYTGFTHFLWAVIFS